MPTSRQISFGDTAGGSDSPGFPFPGGPRSTPASAWSRPATELPRPLSTRTCGRRACAPHGTSWCPGRWRESAICNLRFEIKRSAEPTGLGAQLGEGFDPALAGLAIRIVPEDRLAPIPAIHDLVNRAGKFDTQSTAMCDGISAGKQTCQYY
jgi:hypothetical protein